MGDFRRIDKVIKEKETMRFAIKRTLNSSYGCYDPNRHMIGMESMSDILKEMRKLNNEIRDLKEFCEND